MHTLYDFITHIKTVEYIVSLLFIAGFLLLWEALKPRPFRTLKHAVAEDTEHIRNTGYGNVMKTIGRIAATPFIGLAYVVALPFTFFIALIAMAGKGVLNLAGGSASFGWRPSEAFLSGRQKEEKEKEPDEDEQ